MTSVVANGRKLNDKNVIITIIINNLCCRCAKQKNYNHYHVKYISIKKMYIFLLTFQTYYFSFYYKTIFSYLLSINDIVRW